MGEREEWGPFVVNLNGALRSEDLRRSTERERQRERERERLGKGRGWGCLRGKAGALQSLLSRRGPDSGGRDDALPPCGPDATGTRRAVYTGPEGLGCGPHGWHLTSGTESDATQTDSHTTRTRLGGDSDATRM